MTVSLTVLGGMHLSPNRSDASRQQKHDSVCVCMYLSEGVSIHTNTQICIGKQ